MSATPVEPTAVPAEPQSQAPDMGTDPDWRAEAEKWKALSRKHEEQSKANADKARQFDELAEAQKSEQQKLADRLADAERKAAEAELRALRADVAQAKGVPAGLLSGSSAEELEASADALLAFRGEAPKAPPVPSAAGQGKVGAPVGSGAADIDGRIAEAQKAGDVRLAMRLTNQKLVAYATERTQS